MLDIPVDFVGSDSGPHAGLKITIPNLDIEGHQQQS